MNRLSQSSVHTSGLGTGSWEICLTEFLSAHMSRKRKEKEPLAAQFSTEVFSWNTPLTKSQILD